MVYCPNCNEYFDEDFSFCPHCGAEKPKPLTCPKCGTQSYEYSFCPNCGEKLKTQNELKIEAEKKKEGENKRKKAIQHIKNLYNTNSEVKSRLLDKFYKGQIDYEDDVAFYGSGIYREVEIAKREIEREKELLLERIPIYVIADKYCDFKGYEGYEVEDEIIKFHCFDGDIIYEDKTFLKEWAKENLKEWANQKSISELRSML